jgi:hypothetical protein
VLIVVVMKRDDENGIDERSHRFFVAVLGFVDTIPVAPNTKKLIEQLAAAAGSIGGNREEAQHQCIALLDEGRQLARILGKIVVTSKLRHKDGAS